MKSFSFKNLGHANLERNINLERNAKSDASVNKPAAGSHDKSSTERNAIREGSAFFDNQILSAKEIVTKLSGLLTNARANVGKNPYSGKDVILRNNLQSLFSGRDQKIKRLKKNIEVARHNIDVFKNEHHLRREPRVTHWWHGLLAIAVIVCLISYETYFNGTIFADQMRGGLGAGTAMAVGISMVNVFLSFLMGMALPNLWYQTISHRVMGGIFFLSYLSVIAYMNALFGVYRTKLDASSAGEIDFETTTDLGVVQVVGNPFTQLDVLNQDGQLFMLVGILFAIISLVDGLVYRDTYKGYGALGNKFHNAKKELNEERTRLNNRFVKIKDEVIQDLLKTRDDQHKNLILWDDVNDRLQALKRSFERLVISVEETVSHCLDEYISINRANRFHAVPAYWPDQGRSVNWQLDSESKDFSYAFSDISQEILEDDDMKELVKEKTKEIQSNYEYAESKVNEVSDEFDTKLNELQTD